MLATALTRPDHSWWRGQQTSWLVELRVLGNRQYPLGSRLGLFAGRGDLSVGIALTAAAVPLWVYLSLIEECRRRVERAIAALVPATGADAHLEMKLQTALGASLGRVGGAATEMESAWTKTLDLAEGLGDVDYQLRALWGLWEIRDREALALAQRFAAVASTPADRLIGDQMIGYSCHYRGDQSSARRHLEHVIANHV